MEDPNALLWAVLYEGNLSILKKLTYELMDFRALHPKTGLTMLLYVIDRSFAQDSDGAYNYPGIEVIQWLLSMGADVTQKVPPESSCKPIKLWLVDYDDLWNSLGEYEVAIPFAGHSAISYIVELQRVLAENPHQDFEFEETFLQDFWPQFTVPFLQKRCDTKKILIGASGHGGIGSWMIPPLTM